MPAPPASVLGAVGKLVGVHDQMSVLDLPVVQQIVRGIPGSLLVQPDAAQARLPYDIDFE